jgi:hypothetical protein
MRAFGILSELFARAALTQEIPKAVELDVHIVKTRAIGCRHGAALIEKRMLFGDEFFDRFVELLVVHKRPYSPNPAASRPAAGITERRSGRA